MSIVPKKRGFMGYQKRFDAIGFHPDIDKTGSMKKDRNRLGPGQYNPEDEFCISKKRAAIDGKSKWKWQSECEEFSQNLGFKNAEILATREFMAKHLGPGSHDIPEKAFKQADVSPCNDQNFGKQRKFHIFEDSNPGPGTYKVNKLVCDPNVSPVSWCRAVRFRDPTRSWMLSPDRYWINDPESLQALMEKLVSLRGPYDLFTGPRNESNMFNKFAKGKPCGPDKFYTWPSKLEWLLRHKNNKNRGAFLKAVRFLVKPTVRMMLNDISMCYKDPNAPGPASYNVPNDGIRKLPEAKYAFGITGIEARAGLNWKISPGPGRYHLRAPKCWHAKGGTSVFKSKTQRTQYKVVEYNNF